MKLPDKIQTADDLISFMSGFGIPYTEAADILRIAKDRIGYMTPSAYDNMGKSVAAFNSMTDTKPETTN